MLNWIMRYQPVIKLLDELGAEKVLDVGSGWYGLSWYWPRSVVQTDLYFTGNAPSPVERAGTAEFVPATAEDLPFADKSFDYAVSLDMMEHLPADIRGKTVAELARVSRMGFVIGYPVGDAAARLDRRLAKMWSVTPGAAVPGWLEEHMAQAAYPDRDTLVAALPPGWRIAREIPSGNTALQTAIVYGETLRGLRHLAGLAERRARQRPLPKILDRGKTYRTVWLVLPDQGSPEVKAVEGSTDWESMPGHPGGSELEAALALARTEGQGAGPPDTTLRSGPGVDLPGMVGVPDPGARRRASGLGLRCRRLVRRRDRGAPSGQRPGPQRALLPAERAQPGPSSPGVTCRCR